MISSSEAENKPKTEKLKYFYKASTFSKMFFSWIFTLISVPLPLPSMETKMISNRKTYKTSKWKTVLNLSSKIGSPSGTPKNTKMALLLPSRNPSKSPS